MRARTNNSDMQEEEYFRKRDAEIRAKLKDKDKMNSLGISDEQLAKNILDAGFNQDSMQALFIVPLIETAWADDEILPEEKKQILETLSLRGIKQDSEAYKLVSLWLEKPPQDHMFERAKQLLEPLIQEMKSKDNTNLNWILESSKKVALASGCLMNRIGIKSKISKKEEEILNKIAKRISSH